MALTVCMGESFSYSKTSELGMVKVITNSRDMFGCTAIQIFLKPPSRTEVKTKLSEEFIENIKNIKNMKIIVHSPYMLNLARVTKSPRNAWIINTLIDDVNNAEKIGAMGCVIHMGKHLNEMSPKTAIDNMSINLINVLGETYGTNAKIYVETPCGAGTEVCNTIMEMSRLYKRIVYFDGYLDENFDNRFEFCIDTAHIFAAGYDISDEKGAQAYLDEFEKHIGLSKIGVIHLNNSERKCNSHVDRHAPIDDGYIGKSGLGVFVKFGRDNGIPIILETGNKNSYSELKYIKEYE